MLRFHGTVHWHQPSTVGHLRLNRHQHLSSTRLCHVHPRPTQDVAPTASPRPACALKPPSKRRILPSPSRRERAAVAPPIHPPPQTGRAMAAISPMPLQATDRAASAWKPAARIVRKPHAGTEPLAASPSPSPSRCRTPLALKAARAAHDGPRGMLRADRSIQSRLRVPPCRPHCRRSSTDSHRCR